MRGRGSRRRVSGDLATAARVPAPRAPSGGPAPVPLLGMRAQVPAPVGGDLGQGDPGQEAEVGPSAVSQGEALEVKGFRAAGDEEGAPALCPTPLPKQFKSTPSPERNCGGGWVGMSLQRSESHQDSKDPFPTPHPQPLGVQERAYPAVGAPGSQKHPQGS